MTQQYDAVSEQHNTASDNAWVLLKYGAATLCVYDQQKTFNCNGYGNYLALYIWI